MDMLPETNERKKTSINDKSYLTYINNSRFNYEHQYMRNMLHVNNGLNSGIKFSEVGQLSGVFQTEWSWSALFADFDNDGLKDLVITNGFPKDITDKDFVKYRTDVGRYMSNTMLLDSVPVVKIPNYAYKNSGGLVFNDVTKDWGFMTPSFSNGAAFADLDNDGDLDYIVNNINDKAFVYENRLYSKEKVSSHYIRLKLKGSPKNKEALGAKVSLYYDSGKMQYIEHQTVHGYLSSVESILHFGLGSVSKVDSIKVVWQDGNEQRFLNLTSDQVLSLEYDPSKFVKKINTSTLPVKLLHEISKDINLLFKHDEEDRIDYNIQRTLPHKFTQFGPGISVGDINNDQLEDIVIGGSSGFPTSFFVQENDGSFLQSRKYTGSVKVEEDEGLLLFDADNDNDLDLYIVSGSIEQEPGSKYYQDRLYVNNGQAGFSLDETALPTITSSGSCVRAADFDADGDLDLFVGGRVVPGSYPLPPNSYILRNDKGKFTNVIESICPEFSTIGMVTDALFSDFNNDGKPDIIVVGEFMQINFFVNKEGHFSKVENTGLENYLGWWNSITSGDFDQDGDIDYIAGNLGLNNPYQISENYPLKIYAKDFDNNKSIDAIMACYIKESLSNDSKKLYPIHFWDELNGQSPRFRKQFSGYKQYGKSTLENMLSKEETSDALILEVNYVESSYIENLGNGKFKIKALPQPVQISPINGMIADDFNKDGTLDILMVGNDFGNEVFAGRYDAFTGLLLLGNGKGEFSVSTSAENGFYVPGDAKGFAKLATPKADIFIATQNLDSVKVFKAIAPSGEFELRPESLDSWAELIYSDGRKQRVEFSYGSGYLSQSTRRMRIPKNVKEIIVYDSKGNSRKIVPSGI
ncbi:MAG TPA: VCBS repeat-containing protein, partial [Chryseolinea sp.]|nr:VCBS repeat-containing protein [Chryseolinea sp.]